MIVHCRVLWVGLFACCCMSSAPAQEEHYVELASGLRLGPGVVSETDSISTNAFQRGGGGEVQGKSIGILDDGLRLTFYNASPRNVLRVETSTAPPNEQIELPAAQERAKAGNPPSILGIKSISEFNRYGRRTFSFLTPRGQVDVLQGITLLTPTFTKVEILNTKTHKFVWDSRIATSSIPAAKLREILEQAMDLERANDWLRMVSFYTQAERYAEAREVLAQAIQRFPELGDRQAILGQLDQMLANQKFEEIKLRRDSGQQELATRLLGSFPVQALPLETQIQLGDEVKKIQQQLVTVGDISTALKETVDKLKEQDRQLVMPVIQEILDEVSLETIVRLADFQRLRTDDSTANENKVAFAISGWLLGTGAGIDNFAVAKSLIRVRALVEEYLGDARQDRRRQILEQLRSEEGAQPALLARLLNVMKPPQQVPDHIEGDPPGFVRVPCPHADYLVQVPPEYDPNRKYPCILALPGKNELALTQINWWCGPELPVPSGGKFRFGQATRYGYIVISPNWMKPKQPEYQYTEGEKARILGCLRDAFRKFSIDTDRVFISGHYDGATAAWDLALSHPDHWAGAIMISPGADKYIVQYSENVEGKTASEIPVGTYIVYGDSDGTRYDSQLGRAATRYLKTPTYDTLVVEYRGRGRERFISELPRIMEWMELSTHRRRRTPTNIMAKTMRPGDRFFYWLEAPSLLPTAAGNPFLFDPSKSGVFEGKILEPTINGVTISRMASANKSAIIWLTPQMVDFTRPITVNMPGKRHRFDLAPDIGIMLEDARTRGDRMHVFWQRVSIN